MVFSSCSICNCFLGGACPDGAFVVFLRVFRERLLFSFGAKGSGKPVQADSVGGGYCLSPAEKAAFSGFVFAVPRLYAGQDA